MKKFKQKDIFNLFLMIGIPFPCFCYFLIHFYQRFDQSSVIGQNVCLIIAAAFLWGIADILWHYVSIVKEHDLLNQFRDAFTGTQDDHFILNFSNSIIGHRYHMIQSLKNSFSDIRHDVLSDTLSSKENGRAIVAKYFIGACVMLGLFGSFLGLLETVGGVYSAIEGIGNSDALLNNLQRPLSGMSLIFGTSIVGIIASLSLGFALIFLSRSQLSFLSELEEFTQLKLLPGLNIASNKKIDDVLEKLENIEKNTRSFTDIRQEIRQEAEKIFTSIEGHYSRLTRSVQDEMEKSTRSLMDIRKGMYQDSQKLFTSIDGYYSNLSRSIQDNINETVMSATDDLAGAFSSLMESASQWINDLNQMMETSVSGMNENVAGQMNIFLTNVKKSIQNMLDEVNATRQKEIESTSVLLTHHAETNQSRMDTFLTDTMQAYQEIIDSFITQWSSLFEQEVLKATHTMVERSSDVYQEALNRNEALFQQNMTLFGKTSNEFISLGSELRQMHELYKESLNQTTQAIKDNITGFSDILQQEQHTNEQLSERNEQIGIMLEEVASLLQGNQTEMQAALAMFVEGVDNLLKSFQLKARDEEKEKEIVDSLESSLNELTEKSGNVLLEYVARSREIYSGLLENQLHLTRKLNEMTQGEKGIDLQTG